MPITGQDSGVPPIRNQSSRRALGDAQKVLDLLSLEVASPEEHRLGEAASNGPAYSHFYKKL